MRNLLKIYDMVECPDKVHFCPQVSVIVMNKMRGYNARFINVFFLKSHAGKLYSSDNIVTSFANRAVIKVGCESTQKHENFSSKACLASSCAT